MNIDTYLDKVEDILSYGYVDEDIVVSILEQNLQFKYADMLSSYKASVASTFNSTISLA